MAISGGYIKELTKSEYDDCIYAAGRFCTTLTHMVAAEHAESCLFALYKMMTIHKDIAQLNIWKNVYLMLNP